MARPLKTALILALLLLTSPIWVLLLAIVAFAGLIALLVVKLFSR